MKKTFIAAVIASVSSIATLGVAHAEDGTIDFTGEIVTNTCTIGGAGKNFSVALPPVSTTSLAAGGQTAGTTGFAIELINCDPKSGQVTAFFEADAGVDMNSGRLKNLTPTPVGAGNVQVELLNENFGPIKIGAPVNLQNLVYADIDTVTGGAKLQYFARYYATALAEAGDVDAKARYTLTYQ
ncbi:fimbrial protein [Achromobacter sp. Root83]|uniref:fimbrial protein n=1 Tax=Achromobacter sp. Root83 TaxID=1736602 RepID=UPI000A485565|nr:fimbrial protein [Achromobacter sp. Root83]